MLAWWLPLGWLPRKKRLQCGRNVPVDEKKTDPFSGEWADIGKTRDAFKVAIVRKAKLEK